MSDKHNNLASHANQLVDKHNNEVNYNTVQQVKVILDKIFAMPAHGVTKSKHLEIYPLGDEKFIRSDDPERIVFDLKANHIQYLMEEGFHMMYSPSDSCHLVYW